jgi:hypothetical protein
MPFVITVPTSSVRSVGIECRGAIGTRRIHGTVRAFFTGDNDEQPAALACSYRIPRQTAGKTFSAWVNTTFESVSGGVTHGDGAPHSWRIARR